MAIVIPSKNIYSINFDPVIDNQIDKVEVETNIVKIEYGNVLNSSLSFNFYEYDYNNKTINYKWHDAENTNGFQFILERFSNTIGYLSATIKLLINKKCEMPLSQDEQNNTIINHYKLKSTKQEQFFTVKGTTGELAYDYELMFTREYTEYYTPQIISYDKEKNEIILNYKVKAAESMHNVVRFVITDEISLIGNYPTIEKVTTLVGNGNKTYSFDGNELIQTTNTPTQESKYQGVIREWQNGKQTAIISCPIANYYDESNELKISPYAHTEKVSIECLEALLSGTGTFQEIKTRRLSKSKTAHLEQGGIINIFNYNPQTGVFFATSKTMFQPKKVYEVFLDIPFMFDIGDIIIPYSYTNKGDKPIAYNKDFTPKQFKIVGVNISKKQGVQQVLTAQEV